MAKKSNQKKQRRPSRNGTDENDGPTSMDKSSKSKILNQGTTIQKNKVHDKKHKEDDRDENIQFTMKDLEEISDDDDDDDNGTNTPIPPESEWNDDAKALKAAIESGKFNKLLQQTTNKDDDDDDESSFEEATLDDDDDDEEEEDDGEEDTLNQKNKFSAIPSAAAHIQKDEEVEDKVEEEQVDEEEEEEEDDNDAEDTMEEMPVSKAKSSSRSKNDEDDDDDDPEEKEDDQEETGEVDDDDDNEEEEDNNDDDDDNDDEEEAEEEEDNEGNPSATKKAKTHNNATAQATALHVVTSSLMEERKGWSWAETFDVMPSEPLPFGTQDGVNIHDDLKREVSFYDAALQAVLEAKEKCQKTGVLFSRPEDFFAEMVKTDEHMAKIKDRLIFENKKMDAVALRKANKEQKLRSKESQSNKVAEKAKRKKEHFRAVDEWAQSAAANRGKRLNDRDDVDAHFGGGRGNVSPNKKRQAADKKYGHGGKRGHFKQTDPKALNDMSSYNRNGNFGGMGSKKTAKGGSGANRKGKRARDASRSR